jgi:hypothetical protein
MDDSVEHVSTRVSPSKTRAFSSRPGFPVRRLPSCSGGLQSLCLDDLISHWFDTTASAFALAGPRGRVVEMMQHGEMLHPPLMSLPSRTEFSFLLYASPAGWSCALSPSLRSDTRPHCAPTRCCHRIASASRSLPTVGVMPLAFLEFAGPSTFRCRRSDVHSSSACAALSRPLGLPPQLRCVLGVLHSLDAFFRILPPGLVSCRYRPWASTPSKVSPRP